MKIFVKIWLTISLLAIAIGTAILIIIALFGGGRRAMQSFSVNESYEDVTAIDFNIKYGKVYIKEGSGFSIAAENITGNSFKSYVEDGVWHIDEDDKLVFGWDISFRHIFGRNEKYTRTITITIPQDFSAEKWVLNIGAGEVYVETINADKGYFDVGAGYLCIDRLEIRKESEYNVGAGSLVIKDITATDSHFDCGVGNVEIYGTLTGDNKLSCGVGRIKLELTGKEEDYSYDLSAGLGNVVINNRSYHNINKSINNNTENRLMIDCGIGGIEINFK
jgi:hypothetical protein